MTSARPRGARVALTLALWMCAVSLALSAPYGQTTGGVSDQPSAGTAAAGSLSEQISACRRRGNLFAYYQPLSRCMALLDEEASPCPEPGAVLVLNATTHEASCLRLPCAESQVLLADGRCHEKWTVCSGRENMELVLLETGLGACDCRDGHVFWPTDGRCHAVYSRGPCALGEHLVWVDGTARCEATPCGEGHVPWHGQCVPNSGHGCLDSKHGHLRLNAATLKYQCTLRCPDAMVEVGLDCYKLYSRGPCAVGEYVEPVRGTRYGRCAPNPCDKDGLLPWAGKCWQRGQACGVEDDDDWEETPTMASRTTRAPPSLAMAYSDIYTGAAADSAAPKRAPGTTAGAVASQSVERVSISATVTVSGSTPPSASTTSSSSSTVTTTTVLPTPESTTRSSLPLHLQYLLGNAPDLDQLPFMRHRRPPPPPVHLPPPPVTRPRAPSASVSEALLARRSLVPPPPPSASSGLLELLSLPAFHGQASEPSVSSLPAPMLPEVQYTYDGKMIRNPLYRDRRRRRAVSAAAPTPEPAPSAAPTAAPGAGARIMVHPDTRQVTCTADVLLAPPHSYAHFKCRPGSRRDALGECHHGGSTYGELHPRRCPHGMRHNRLTGQCRPAA
ncbi:hypothetical protein FJT64_010184 [Amphibalanus amphitrite]|uniref:DUF4789 domain-containing protein n=1 Tax=Amphibalanus amphitrite TaxID=1232801 RepID=A0A6A4V665_AMPAM|nr:hypothetical protein FJT64_010184 [Amphibalanus amphitrite]